MIRTRLAAAVLTCMSMAMASTAVMAQDRDHHGGPPDRQQAQRGGPDRGGPGPDRGGPGPGRDMHARDDHGDRGAGPDHNFRRGGRLPTEYRNRQYVVDDWRNHRLSAPPRGYHWVQTGPDYVLAAIATGVIAQVLLGN